MLEKDLMNLDNQELTELLVALEEMDKLLEEKEKILEEGYDNNENKL